MVSGDSGDEGGDDAEADGLEEDGDDNGGAAEGLGGGE